MTSAWPIGDDETSARLRAFDWAATPLGPIAQWPQCLKCAVDLVLSSQLSMQLNWGPQRVHIYNAACQAFMGRKHPDAFGRPAREHFGEVWDEAEAIHRRVFAGESITLEDHPWTILRDGAPEQTFFTSYFTPVRDETGAVAGELVMTFETTHAVNARRERERFEQERRQSEARLQTAAELVGLGWAYWRPGFRQLDWDNRVRALWGLSPNAPVDIETAMAAVHPDDLPKVEEIWVAAADPAYHSYKADYRVIGIEDGVERWIRAHGRTYEPGDPRAFIGAVLDITEQKRTELALRDGEARLRAAVDLVGLSIYSWDLAADTADWDDSIKAMWGLPRDAKVDSALFLSAVHPEDRPGLDAIIARATDPRGDGIYRAEYRVISRMDGRERWVSTHGQTTFMGGKAVGFVGAVLDITDRKRDEKKLRDSEARLAAILEQLPVGVAVFDNDGRVQLSNSVLHPYVGAMIPSRSSDTAERWRVFGVDEQLLDPSRYPGARALRGETTAPGVDFLHRSADGQELWMRVSAAPLRNHLGEIEGGVAVFLDIDREKRAQETNLMLIAELRHRTRNLLAVVEAVAAEGLASSRSLSDFAETFRSRLSALSRVQAYLSGHGGGLVTIGELVRAELLALGAEHDGERVVVDGPSLVLPGQSVQILALALHELATNARKYGALSAPDGRLSVTWRMTEDAGEPRLLLNWHESGVVVDQAAVSRKGFGRKLIEESLPYQLDARTHLEFGTDEVRCAIILDPGNDGHRHE